MTNTLHSGLVQLGAWFRGEIENEGPDNEALCVRLKRKTGGSRMPLSKMQ